MIGDKPLNHVLVNELKNNILYDRLKIKFYLTQHGDKSNITKNHLNRTTVAFECIEVFKILSHSLLSNQKGKSKNPSEAKRKEIYDFFIQF